MLFVFSSCRGLFGNGNCGGVKITDRSQFEGGCEAQSVGGPDGDIAAAGHAAIGAGGDAEDGLLGVEQREQGGGHGLVADVDDEVCKTHDILHFGGANGGVELGPFGDAAEADGGGECRLSSLRILLLFCELLQRAERRFRAAGGEGFQRPFELATVRLQNMVEVLGHWRTYVPRDDFITQRGGTFLLEADDTLLYSHRDRGILGFSATMNRPLAFLEPFLGD